MSNTKRLFLRFNLFTIIAVYFLILVGGIVRNTGAGMGCPDWPKCFGSYIPPSSSAELPSDYVEIYKTKRIQKNERLASILSSIGLSEQAQTVLSDPAANDNTYYDTTKAWIEYLNRLIGVLIGLLIIINMWFSWKTAQTSIRVLGIASFVLVLFQGWIGSLVVSTNLLPGFISFHMILALLLVAFLFYQRFLMTGLHVTFRGSWMMALLLFMFVIQIVLGTDVREQVDRMNHSGIGSALWIDNMNIIFYIHRSYSIALVGLFLAFCYINYNIVRYNRNVQWIGGLFLVEIALGAMMNYWEFPIITQPAHLFLGTVSFGLIFYLFLSSNLKSSKS